MWLRWRVCCGLCRGCPFECSLVNLAGRDRREQEGCSVRAEQVGCSVPAPRSWQERVHAERRGHRAGLAVVRREREGGSALRVWSHAPEDGRGFAAFRLSLGAGSRQWKVRCCLVCSWQIFVSVLTCSHAQVCCARGWSAELLAAARFGAWRYTAVSWVNGVRWCGRATFCGISACAFDAFGTG